jgi:hypothetical protein
MEQSLDAWGPRTLPKKVDASGFRKIGPLLTRRGPPLLPSYSVEGRWEGPKTAPALRPKGDGAGRMALGGL